MKRMWPTRNVIPNCNFTAGEKVHFLIKEGDVIVHQVTLEVYDIDKPHKTSEYRLYLNDGQIQTDTRVWPVVTKEYGDLHYVIASEDGQVSTQPQKVIVG